MLKWITKTVNYVPLSFLYLMSSLCIRYKVCDCIPSNGRYLLLLWAIPCKGKGLRHSFLAGWASREGMSGDPHESESTKYCPGVPVFKNAVTDITHYVELTMYTCDVCHRYQIYLGRPSQRKQICMKSYIIIILITYIIKLSPVFLSC